MIAITCETWRTGASERADNVEASGTFTARIVFTLVNVLFAVDT